MLPPEMVEQESEAVSGVISEILPSDSVVSDYSEDNMDKLAHVIEYGMLGLFVSLYIILFAVSAVKLAPMSLLLAQAVALFDETIQIFSGRCADVADIWLDILGFSVMSLIIYVAFYCYKYIKAQREK